MSSSKPIQQVLARSGCYWDDLKKTNPWVSAREIRVPEACHASARTNFYRSTGASYTAHRLFAKV